MPINLSAAPAFNSSVNNSPMVQDWSVSPASIDRFYLQDDPEVPAAVDMEILIKDILPNGIQIPSDFKIASRIIYSQTDIEWISPSNESFSFDPDQPDDINESENSGTCTISFNNLELLAAGGHSAIMEFTTLGLIEGSWEPMSAYTYTISLAVISEGNVYISPSPINFFHIQGGAIAPQTLTVACGGTWRLNCGPKYILSEITPGLIVNALSGADNGYTAKGSGVMQVLLTPSAFFNTPAALDGQFAQSSLGAFSLETIAEFTNVDVTLMLSDGLSIVALPAALNFSAIQGIQEAAAQQVVVLSPSMIDILHDPWLMISDSGGPVIPNLYKFLVQPIPSANMTAGSYSGNIVINGMINAMPVQTHVPVNYQLQGFVASPYNANNFAFTLDDELLQFSSGSTGTYFTLDLLVRAYRFHNDQETITELPYKIPLFQQRSEMNIGTIVDRLMHRLPEFSGLMGNQYKAASVSYTVKEIDSAGEVVREDTESNIRFVAGMRPKTINSNCAVLQLHDEPQRITKMGYAYVNLLLPGGPYSSEVFVNGESVGQISLLAAGRNIICQKLVFSDYNIQPGDFVEYRVYTGEFLQDLSAEYVSKKFICFPDPEYSNFIVFEEENKLLNVLEFTGAYKMPSEFENITQVRKVRLAEVLDKLRSKKLLKLMINTGWILGSDQRTIDSLMRSKRSWLINGDEIIDMVAISKSLTNIDSERSTVAFDVEFHINRKYDSQIYSF